MENGSATMILRAARFHADPVQTRDRFDWEAYCGNFRASRMSFLPKSAALATSRLSDLS